MAEVVFAAVGVFVVSPPTFATVGVVTNSLSGGGKYFLQIPDAEFDEPPMKVQFMPAGLVDRT